MRGADDDDGRWTGARLLAEAAGLRVVETDELVERVWAVRTPVGVALARHLDAAWRIRLLAEAVRDHLAGPHRSDVYAQGPDRGGWLRAQGAAGLDDPARSLLAAWSRLVVAAVAVAQVLRFDLDHDGAVQLAQLVRIVGHVARVAS